MNKALIAVVMMAALPLASCGPVPHHRASRHHETKVYHLHDGRVAYEDDYGLWWYMMMNNSSSSTSSTIVNGSRLGFTSSSTVSFSPTSGPTALNGASFARGPAPTEEEIAEATTEQVGAIEVTEAQEMSAEPIEAEAVGGTPEAATSAAETSSASSDSGSSSSDGGGGGGD